MSKLQELLIEVVKVHKCVEIIIILALCVENMSVRPESYKIVMIIFYLSLWTKYLFRQIFAEEKYLHQQNIGKEKISASQKYRFRQNIGGN